MIPILNVGCLYYNCYLGRDIHYKDGMEKTTAEIIKRQQYNFCYLKCMRLSFPQLNINIALFPPNIKLFAAKGQQVNIKLLRLHTNNLPFIYIDYKIHVDVKINDGAILILKLCVTKNFQIDFFFKFLLPFHYYT